ncbi:DUF2730 family protein [Tropicimonas sp. S265A]|uniref:DUF2730 family protein n=1 Tax=Tropicimonas sp. S265A TaxID=3415134 RepID=UPI003C7A3B04
MEVLDWLKATELLVGLVLTFFGGGVGAIFWIQRRIKASAQETQAELKEPLNENGRRIAEIKVNMDRLTGEVSALDSRLKVVESDVRQAPSKDDVHQLELQLAGMSGALRELGADMRGTKDLLGSVKAALDRQEQFLLNKGGT